VSQNPLANRSMLSNSTLTTASPHPPGRLSQYRTMVGGLPSFAFWILPAVLSQAFW
jgi:hypothetical protein